MTEEIREKKTDATDRKQKRAQTDAKLAHLNEPWRHLYELIQKHVK